MKKIAFAALSLVVFAASSSVFAEGKTRAQVYQELIEAQQNGLDYITDASYPDVSPVFARQVEQHKQALAAQAAAAASRVASSGAPAVGAGTDARRRRLSGRMGRRHGDVPSADVPGSSARGHQERRDRPGRVGNP